MNEVYCVDLVTKKKFTLKFNDLTKQRNFINKCKYSKKIKVVGYTFQSRAEYEYLAFGW